MLSDGSGVHLLGRTQRFLLEFSTVLYFFARNSAIPLMQQYIYFLVARKYNFTTDETSALLKYAKEAGEEDGGSGKDLEVDDGVPTTTAAGSSSVTKNFTGDAATPLFRDVVGRRYSPEELGLTATPDLERSRLEERIQLSHRINEESSLIVLYLSVAELLPAAVVVVFLGCYSDATGRRKFMMWIPCVGNAVYALGFLLPLYVTNGDIDSPVTKAFFVVACLCSGISGNVPGFLSGNASYISDTDSPRRRTLRLAIVEMSIGLTFGISSLLNGYWISATSHYEQPLWFLFVFSLIPFVIIFFFLVEPTGEVASELGGHGINGGYNFRNLYSIRHVFGCKTIPQKKLWAIFFAFQIYVFVQQGQERTFVLFLQNHPLHWTPTQIGTFLFVLYVLAGFGSWPGVPILQRMASDLTIAAIALLSKLVGSLLLGVAQGSVIVYLSGVVQLFHLIPFAIGRSLASQQMGEDEQGSIYAMLHSAQSLVSFVGPVVYNSIFAATLSTMSGTVFLVSGPLLLVPLLLLGCTRYLEIKEGGYSKPFSPSSLTPLSDTAGFAQRSSDFGESYYDDE